MIGNPNYAVVFKKSLDAKLFYIADLFYVKDEKAARAHAKHYVGARLKEYKTLVKEQFSLKPYPFRSYKK